MTSNSATTASNREFLLHTNYRSSCSGRLRIALNLKNIPAEYCSVQLFKGEQRSEKYKELNPSGTVPVLSRFKHGSDEVDFSITQSIAALEYLEEAYPGQAPLLPPVSQPVVRAKVRTLVNIISIDIQPLQNRRVAQSVAELGADSTDWVKGFILRGFQAYESISSETAGRFSVGDSITLADVCLVPQVWAAEQNDVELEKFPTIMRVYRTMSDLEAVQKAHWSRQEDTPADMAWR